MEKLNIEPIVCKNWESLWHILNPANRDWEGIENWVFRGQPYAGYKLLPKVFRPLHKDYKQMKVDSAANLPLKDWTLEGGLERIQDQIKDDFNHKNKLAWKRIIIREYSWIYSFVEKCGRTGLGLPREGHDFITNYETIRSQDNPSPKRIRKDRQELIEGYPQTDLLETIALAQHHGVPTRFIDFSFSPLAATYFAACSSYKPWNANSDSMSIWAINRLEVLRTFGNLLHFYFVRGCTDSFLENQSGLFVIYKKANEDLKTLGYVRSIDEVICDAVRHEFAASSAQCYVDKYVKRIDMPLTERATVIMALDNLGINHSSLLPSYESIVRQLDFMKDIGSKDWLESARTPFTWH